MKNNSVSRHLLCGLILVLLAGLPGCKEIDIPVIVDEDEIERYIYESDVGIELFRTNNLIPDDHYTIPGDPGAVFVDLVDSVKRTVDVYILLDHYGVDGHDYVQDFGDPYGITRDAEVTVTDNFYLRTLRIEGNDTSTYTYSGFHPVERYAYFMKLGTDSQAFRGWLMMGYSGGGPSDFTHADGVRADNSTFPADPIDYQKVSSDIIDVTTSDWDTLTTVNTRVAYLWLSGAPQVARIDEGEIVRIQLVSAHDSSMFFTMSGETDAGFSVINSVDGDSVHTATIDTPSNNDRPWNILYLREYYSPLDANINDVPFDQLSRQGWCVPYRIEN